MSPMLSYQLYFIVIGLFSLPKAFLLKYRNASGWNKDTISADYFLWRKEHLFCLLREQEETKGKAKQKISRHYVLTSSLLLFDGACSSLFQHDDCHIYKFIQLYLNFSERVRREGKPMWLNKKIKNTKSWSCFQALKGKLTVALKAEMQVKKRKSQQKSSSNLFSPLSASQGAKSSAESVDVNNS